MFKENISTNKVANPVADEKLLNQLIELTKVFIKDKNLTPPIPQNKLIGLTHEFITFNKAYEAYTKLIAILINNAIWQPIVASIPFNKRILLLPKCFRNQSTCKAITDEIGLLCELCGNCNLTKYITNAEQLGYQVIVSEGSGSASTLLKTGQIECVIGVACIDSFENSFPILLEQAIPSIAIPLYNSDCKNSATNEPWLMNTLKLKTHKPSYINVPVKLIKNTVNNWFSETSVNALLPYSDKSAQIAKQWLMAGGKRWRPLIMANIYSSLTGNYVQNKTLSSLGLAIECFHKASLAHDDIVDNDTLRYGNKSLLNEHSMNIALNTGDLMLSYGYELIAGCDLPDWQIKQLITCATKAHRELCVGQGEELLHKNKMQMPAQNKVIEIFELKTAPAFEVSLLFGAILANANQSILKIIQSYSTALGIAYQIKDDINDFNPENINNDISDFRLSIILSMINENNKNILNKDIFKINEFAINSGIIKQVEELLHYHKTKALQALETLDNTSLKILLYRLVNQILK